MFSFGEREGKKVEERLIFNTGYYYTFNITDRLRVRRDDNDSSDATTHDDNTVNNDYRNDNTASDNDSHNHTGYNHPRKYYRYGC